MAEGSQKPKAKGFRALVRELDAGMGYALLERDPLAYHDVRCAAIQSILEGVKDRNRSGLAFLRKQNVLRNSFVRFNRFPWEILHRIFRLSIEDIDVDKYQGRHLDVPSRYFWLLQLCRVCKFWKNILEWRALLWRRVSLYARPQLNQKALSLSSGVSIIVDCNIRPEDDDRKERSAALQTRIDHFASIFNAHGSRWGEARLIMQRFDLNIFRGILESPESSLVSVELQSFDEETAGAPINMLGGTSGRLKSVRVDSVPLVWTSPTLFGLESLSIRFLREHAPSVRCVLNILRNSPRLSSLKLEGVIFQEDQVEDEVDNPNPITLPNLTSFTLGVPVAHHCELILRHLQPLRQCRAFSLGVYLTGEDCDMSSLDCHTPTLQKILSKCISGGGIFELSITHDRSMLATIYTEDRSYELDLMFRDAARTAKKIVRWLVDIVQGSATPVPLEVHLCCNPAWDLEFLGPLQDIDITKLNISQIKAAIPDHVDIFSQLSSPVAGEMTSCWLIPRLHTLQLSIKQMDGPALLTMLRNRYGPPSDSFPPPATLSELYLQELPHVPSLDVLEEMRQILGHEVAIKLPQT